VVWCDAVSGQSGLFGSVTNLLSFPKTRKALFDVAIAGPVAGFVASLACMLYGTAHPLGHHHTLHRCSHFTTFTCHLRTSPFTPARTGLSLTASATPEALATYPAIPAGFLSASFLLNQLVDSFLHVSDAAAAAAGGANPLGIVPPTQLIPLHPLVPVGMTGLLTNAYNFLPIGRLDGGRVATAVAGRQAAGGISQLALLSQAVAFFSNSSPTVLYWLLVVVFLQRGADLPPEDDVTPVATAEEDRAKGPLWLARAAALMLCTVLTAAAVTPVPAPQQPFDAAAPTTRTDGGLNSLLQGLPQQQQQQGVWGVRERTPGSIDI
jgi:membrane-associated protease RseP (regulator of RpoE activity)